MSPERWERLKRIFGRALELQGAARSRYLEEACADDPELRRELEALLEQESRLQDEFVPLPLFEGLRAGAAEEPFRERLGGCRLLRELGRGARGIVYLGWEEAEQRFVAVKAISPFTPMSALQSERLVREAAAAARLDHPGIVRIHRDGVDDGVHYQVMELVDGPCLAEELRAGDEGVARFLHGDGPDYFRRVAEVVKQVAAALDHAHQRGVIHRDIKPQNVLLDPEGRPRIVDLGLAKDLFADTLTGTGQAEGTPHYMSPEQIRAEKGTVDARADVYSLGVVLYELLTRRKPFGGETVDQVLFCIAFERPRPPRSLRSGIPRDLETACLKAMEKCKEDRYLTAAEMAFDLERFLRGEPILGRRPSLATRSRRTLWTRRKLVAGIAVGAAAGVYALTRLTKSQAQSLVEKDWPRMSVAARKPFASAQLTVRPVVDEFGTLGEVEVSRPSPVTERAVRPGLYRIAGRGEDGEFGESYQVFSTAEERDILRLRITAPGQEWPGMVAVPGGPVRIESGEERTTHEIRPFWIDAHAVSNRAYLDYLEQSGRSFWPPHWPARGSEDWEALPQRFWRLPVCGVTYQEATEFAAWHGKRLPTRTEWELAARGPDEYIYPWGDTSDEIFELSNLADDFKGGTPTWEDYLLRTAPADECPAGGVSPFGLKHVFGNLLEWSCSLLGDSIDDKAGTASNPMFYVLGVHWSAAGEKGRKAAMALLGLSAPRIQGFAKRSLQHGFRCARSVELA